MQKFIQKLYDASEGMSCTVKCWIHNTSIHTEIIVWNVNIATNCFDCNKY